MLWASRSIHYLSKHHRTIMSASTAHQHIPNTLPLAGGIPDTHRPHTESTTTILVPKENTAFLNPVQQYNRDLSISVIRAWNELRKEEAEARWRKRQERAAEGAKKRKDKQAAGKAGEEGVEGAIVEEGLTEVSDGMILLAEALTQLSTSPADLAGQIQAFEIYNSRSTQRDRSAIYSICQRNPRCQVSRLDILFKTH